MDLVAWQAGGTWGANPTDDEIIDVICGTHLARRAWENAAATSAELSPDDLAAIAAVLA